MELSDEARQFKNAYLRKWRAANPEKVREHNRRYWERRYQKNLLITGKKQENGTF